MAYGQEESGTGEWRARYKRPDGTWGSKSGFPTEKAGENWGLEQEALIRRNLWLDPRDGETRFEDFAEEWLAALEPRLELNTIAKYRSFLDNQLLPQWKAWPLVAIFNGYVEIERWLSDLHEDYAESSVSSYFALFSTILNGVRMSNGEFETRASGGHAGSGVAGGDAALRAGFGHVRVRAVLDGFLYRRPMG